MNDTLVCVTDDVGMRVWLERALSEHWALEFVSGQDLSRVSRLVKASQCPVILAAIDAEASDRATKLFSALHQANPGVNLMGVASHISQDLLLSVMRVGVRDCLITSVDTERANDRVRVCAADSEIHENKGRSGSGAITLLFGAGEVVDTRFFAQNLVCELNQQQPDSSILAIDTLADENQAFYLDNLSRLTLNALAKRTENIDEAFVNTALEEYLPGLRLLSGHIQGAELAGDSAADLFIAITRLSEIFSHLIIRIDHQSSEAWLKIVGADLTRLVILANPLVDQVRYLETFLKQSPQWLEASCTTHVLIDGYEKKAVLSSGDIEKSIGVRPSVLFPVDWLPRLNSINAGIPLSALPKSCAYQRKLTGFVKECFGETVEPKGHFGLFKRSQAAEG